MAGGQLLADDVGTIVQRGGVREIHLGSAVTRTVAAATAPDGSETGWSRTDAQQVAALVAQIQAMRGA
jgi:hypothetical protein